MTTYRDLLEKLMKMNDNQLDSEIKFLPVGWSDYDVPSLEISDIASSFELVFAEEDVVYAEYSSDSYMESGYSDYLSFEGQEEEKEEGQVNTLVVKKGYPYFGLTD